MSERTRSTHVILGLTEIWRRTGGIPAFNQILIQAGHDSGLGITVVALNDRPEDRPARCVREHVIVCQRRRRSFIWALMAGIATHRRPLLVLGHVGLAPIGLLLRLMRPGLRYVVVGYGVEAWARSGWLTRASLRRATRIAAISRFTAGRMVESNGVRPAQIFLLRSVVRIELQARLEDRRLEDARQECCSSSESISRAPTLMTTGRLDSQERYKGHDRVIHVLPQILRCYARARYTIVGEGDDMERLKSLANKIGVSENVDFLGFVPSEALDRYYRDCDVFVMPSTGEGFGIVFLEAMLYGKPVVAGNRDGSGEPVENGRTGWLVDPDDPDALAEAILDLLDDPERAAAFGSAGRERVLQEFTMNRFQQDFDRLVSEVAP